MAVGLVGQTGKVTAQKSSPEGKENEDSLVQSRRGKRVDAHMASAPPRMDPWALLQQSQHMLGCCCEAHATVMGAVRPLLSGCPSGGASQHVYSLWL